MKKEKIKGSIIAYATVIFQIIISFLFTPLLIRGMGIEEYGLYETINSLGGTLLVVNFGISSIVSRNIVKYKKEDSRNELENFLSMSLIISMVIFIFISILGVVASNYIRYIYKDSLTGDEIIKARTMFIYIIINLGLMTWRNYTAGIITGYEKFSFSSFTKLLKQIIRVTLLSVLLMIKHIDGMTVVIVDMIITIILTIIEILYCILKIKVPIKYHKMNKEILKETFLFSMASFIQTITNQINLTLDKVILGAMTDTNTVAIYSVGLLIVNVMVSILQVISGFYLPDATRLVLANANGDEYTDFIVVPGRIQSIIGCGIVFGFLLIGKEFLGVWVGDSFKQMWFPTIILLLFTMLTYVTSVANVILDAMLKKMSRSLILICTAILNVIITIILIKPLGFFGAAIGTAISMAIGNLVFMNIYYKKRIGINIFKMYKGIFKGIILCAIVSFFIAYPFKFLIKNEFVRMIICGGLFVISYGITLIKYGLNKSEINFVKRCKNRILINESAR